MLGCFILNSQAEGLSAASSLLAPGIVTGRARSLSFEHRLRVPRGHWGILNNETRIDRQLIPCRSDPARKWPLELFLLKNGHLVALYNYGQVLSEKTL